LPEQQETIQIQIPAAEAGKRLDAYLAETINGWSRSRLKRLIDDGDVLVNENEVKAGYKLRESDNVEVELTELPAAVFEAENIPLDIVFEDEYMAVVNKPSGMVVHPGAGVSSGTLANAIAYHFKPQRRGGAESADRVGIVHRLDKDTSGLIVVAKDEQTAEQLSRQFHDREVEKSYIALVHGSVEQNSGKIDAPIARDKHNRLRMRVAQTGRNALTLWKVKQRFEKFTLLDIEIKTGRTHQIRVHLAYINHPVLGDSAYNEGRDKTIADLDIRKAVAGLGRFFLHAKRLAFIHPKTGLKMEFLQDLPPELEAFLALLK